MGVRIALAALLYVHAYACEIRLGFLRIDTVIGSMFITANRPKTTGRREAIGAPES
jgi:hypothetical protein